MTVFFLASFPLNTHFLMSYSSQVGGISSVRLALLLQLRDLGMARFADGCLLWEPVGQSTFSFACCVGCGCCCCRRLVVFLDGSQSFLWSEMKLDWNDLANCFCWKVENCINLL